MTERLNWTELSPTTSWQIDGEISVKTVTYFIFLGSKITADGDCSHEIKRCLLLGRKAFTNLDSILKSRDITLPTKVHLVKAMCFFLFVCLFVCFFSSSHIWMWELDYKESWMPNNWCFWTVVLEKTLACSLDCKEIQPVNPKWNQSWIGKTDVEAETPILSPPDVKKWLIWKSPDAKKDWRQEEKGMPEDEMVEWHHQLDGRWVWVSSGSWWWTGKPGVLQSMGLQKVGHYWATELNIL